MNKKKQDKVGHHTVPREYLRGFTDPSEPEVVNVYRPHMPPFRTGVAGIAKEKHFYTIERDDGTRDSNLVEDFLAKNIEVSGNKVLDKIRARRNITPEERLAFSIYISVLLTRVPKHRARATPHFPEIIELERSQLGQSVKTYLAELREQPQLYRGDPNEPGLEEKLLRTAEQLLDEHKQKMPNKFNVALVSANFAKYFFNMTWVFFTTTRSPGFATSDNPVVFDEALGLYGNPIFRAALEVTVPISTEIVLWATWRPGANEVYIPATKWVVEEINRRTIGAAHREVYYYKYARWLQSLVTKRFGNRQWDLIQLYRTNEAASQVVSWSGVVS